MIKLEICVICENTIQIDDDEDYDFWGYDAKPLKDGNCCFDCWLHEVFKLDLIAANAPKDLLDLLERD